MYVYGLYMLLKMFIALYVLGTIKGHSLLTFCKIRIWISPAMKKIFFSGFKEKSNWISDELNNIASKPI